jgi:hypothetical protein
MISTSSVIPSSIPTSTPILTTSTSISPSFTTNMTSFPLSTLSTHTLSSSEVFDDEFDDFVGPSSTSLNTSVISTSLSVIHQNNEKIELHGSLAEQLFQCHHYKESFQCLYKQHYVSGM